MSRLTASLFHKPSPFEFPRAPLSPPDTNVESITPAQMPTPSVAAGHDYRQVDNAFPSAGSSMDTPGSRFRRVSSIAYHNSGLRESRERAAPKSSCKSFVIVVPPLSLIQEHGQLGHTLSTGPQHRLSQGIIMPLFPTMYGQLTAIAREFNFPSTAGLCLYLQLTEDGITMTPRISDDSWQLIWGHIFDSSTPTSSSLRGPPIGGKLEFDIDLRQARWYAAWISSLHREHLDVPVSAFPSAAPSVVHYRAESRTTLADDHVLDNDHQAAENTSVTSRHAPSRHVPRKLSLVDRFDVVSTRSDSRPASRSALSPPEQQHTASQVLSPIFQEEEPKSARNDINSKIKSWRASAVLKPSALSTTGQMSLEPANMPNNVYIDDGVIDTPADELNLEDFDWSVTSAGPEDYDPMSPLSWDRVSSVHIANRLEGSVCLTPSDCTSFGPSDYSLPSPVPSFDRLPSPDLAYRMFEDSPPTPLTATSWGPPLSYPPSPMSDHRAPSVDIGERMVFSRPLTPSTATSWGPSDRSWPLSPMSTYSYSRSIHLADRGEYSRPITPCTATSWGAPLSYPPSPTTPFYVQTPDAGHRGFEDISNFLMTTHRPWNHSWPYNCSNYADIGEAPSDSGAVERSAIEDSHPWGHSWPYHSYNSEVDEPQSTRPWAHAWPYNRSLDQDEMMPNGARPWGHSWPYITPNPDSLTKQPGSAFDLKGVSGGQLSSMDRESVEETTWSLQNDEYPCFNLYPAIYPHFDLYPAVFKASKRERVIIRSRSTIHTKLEAVYPMFNLYPAVYPENLNEIYPVAHKSIQYATHEYALAVINVKLSVQYPVFDLYPAVYPHIELYPGIVYTSTEALSAVKSKHYPDFELYPDVSISGAIREDVPQDIGTYGRYPVFNLYPAVYPYFDLYPLTGGYIEKESSKHESNNFSGYPVFDLYPALPQLVAQVDDLVAVRKNLVPQLRFEYPIFTLYPAVYPYLDIYPALPVDCWKSSIGTQYGQGYPYFNLYPPAKLTPPVEALTYADRAHFLPYPVFDLYPAVYPYLDIYPSIGGKMSNVEGSMVIVGQSLYPTFNIYPAVYPFFDLYPHVPEVPSPFKWTVSQSTCYPTFDLYPAVYPHFNLYPSVTTSETEGLKTITTKIVQCYPSFVLYPSVYPYFDLWPSVLDPIIDPRPTSSTKVTKLTSRLTHSELHAMVMMESFGARVSFSRKLAEGGSSRKSHRELHLSVFSNGIVDTPSSRNNGVDDFLEANVRRRMASERLLSGSTSSRPPPPVAPSPNRRLPPPPSVGPSLSSAFEMMTPLMSDPGFPSTRTLPARRSSLASRPPPSRAPPSSDMQHLPMVEERSNIFRSSSLHQPSFKRAQQGSTDSSSPTIAPTRSGNGKRDSLVLQRVRAYNSSTDDSASLSVDALSKFPMPPRGPLPPIAKGPKGLNRSKSPFA
ncbi:hypothetical protein BDQ12DRAFT_675075 [Crucibulum laeve]|uniref:Uncharacterized protein n=1 Tax=Crucibulum laeve TaxID=68775 RepID=A0A5C3MHS2_9AGAR|nr:hypothetical protein BDQ12DRAFT_675075 [Crucibulum laeve]